MSFEKLNTLAQGWSITELIEAFISPREQLSKEGFVGGIQVQERFALKLQQHPQFAKNGHIERRKDEFGNTKYYLFRLSDWNSTYYQTQLKRKVSEIQTVESIARAKRFDATLEKMFRYIPKLQHNKSLAVLLLELWLTDYEFNDECRANLQRFGYFQGIENEEAQHDELKQQLEEWKKAHDNEWY